MRIRRQAKHYAIHFRRGYGNGETASGVFSYLLHYTGAYIAVEIAVPAHVCFSIASSRLEPESPSGLRSIKEPHARKTCSCGSDSAAKEEGVAPSGTYSGSVRSALGYAKDPMVPIIGRMVGKGSAGFEELKETWRTGVSLMIEWMVCRS